LIRAIFFDIDGTLLSYRTHSVLPSTVEAFRRLRQKGILTFISSGRPRVLIPPMPIDFDGFITVNGGLCMAGDTILHSNPISPDDSRHWLEYVQQNDLVTMCFTQDDMFINRIDDNVIRLRDQLGFQMPPVRIIDDFRDKVAYQFIAMQPADDDPKALAFIPNCRMPRWHPAFTDIIPADSSKAVGIQSILNHFGISREESMAFGDGANDIEMLQYVGIGVAMGNASPIVKQHADHITSDADSDGILHALEELHII